MSQLFILAVVATTSVAGGLVGTRLLKLRGGLREAGMRTLETIGVAVLFFLANVGIIVAVVIALRAFGYFMSMGAGQDPIIAGMAFLQALVFQFWRYSAPRGPDR